MVAQPRLSVNRLAEYIMSKGARQRSILKDRKYPDDEFNKGMYHRESSDAISQYIADGAVDPTPLFNKLKSLKQMTTSKVGTARRINSNIDALERFSEMLDKIDLLGATPVLGHNNPPHLKIHNVDVSVRPEIVLRGTAGKGRKCVGAIKLHFSKTWPMNEESAGYVSAIVQEFCGAHLLCGDEIINPTYCQVIDVGSGEVFAGVKATTKRMKDVTAECQNIAALWPSI
jgi:hypothetical protein